ncbi:hypothetical protein NQ315_009176 [Exocentrus adspersus]|uniref:NAD(+) kinase n=1 Tax=Exocentrus adspersus TaxID=1586481 RepID=A0AAV8WHW4_9CUCU|nr:hypothetical protein NQ315_009176 [Exocentrus adspersus]
MYNQKCLLTHIYKGIGTILNGPIQNFSNDAKQLKMDKVLIISKLSRYEYEKRKHRNLDDSKLEQLLRKRGTDFERLVNFHNKYKYFEENVYTTLKNMGINVEIANRFTCTEDKIQEADVILPTGGDGTFLLAASRVMDNKKPVVGFNSDPSRSEGYLCLPKKYSTNVRAAIERLQMGDFDWLLRSRIRITMVVSEESDLVPKYLHGVEGDCICPIRLNKAGKNVLPVLALNEVFMGETLSARVSHLKLRLNGSMELTNIKCSGICVATGTGSTSWHLSINRLPVQSVAELLRLIDIDATEGKDSLATVLADIYNKNLIFQSDDKRMGYTIRDLISCGVWPDPKGIKSRGFATKIEVLSNCYDASLVVDGGCHSVSMMEQ